MICSPAEILVFLGKADSATDHERALVTMLQPMAEGQIKRFLGYNVEQDTHTHYLPEESRAAETDTRILDYDVRGNRVVSSTTGGTKECSILVVPEVPVRSVTSVYEDTGAYGGQGSGDFPASSELTAGTDYWIDYTTSGLNRSGILRRIGSYWPASPRTVRVIYTAGYTQEELSVGIAAPIKMAVLVTVQSWFSTRGDSPGTVKSERLGDYSATYGDEGTAAMAGLPPKAKKLLGPFVHYGRLVA